MVYVFIDILKNRFSHCSFFLGMMFFFTFTYFRQILAVGIIWLALPYYTHRKIWQYMAMVTLATMTHNSAAIMAALYFIPLKKWHTDQILFVMFILFCVGLFGVGDVFSFAGSMTGAETFYEHSESYEYGFRYEYVVESCVFLFLLIQNYKSIKRDKETLSYLNLYLFFCGCLLLFCKSGDGGRISWYSVMGIIIMLTKYCKSKSSQNLRAFLVTMFFALYFRILLAWGIQLYPYKTFFTNGFREGDVIYEHYEYDHQYDKDKFYNL